MRVLWVVNSPAEEMAKLMRQKSGQSGGWVDLARQSIIESCPDLQLAIAITSDSDRSLSKTLGMVTYYSLSAGLPRCGKRGALRSRLLWKQLMADFDPDIIHFWGTETTQGLDVLDVAEGRPSVVYMQGVVSALAKYRNGGLSYSEIWWPSIIDLAKCVFLSRTVAQYRNQVAFERELLQRSGNVICDSEWCLSMCRSLCPSVVNYVHSLPISREFSAVRWNPASMKRHRVFCIGARGPYKGLHVAIKALRLLVDDFPNITLVIPGKPLARGGNRIRESAYFSYLRRLICRNRLERNVEFSGPLSASEMALHMREANVFVMPSCIENHSSTLREAMLVGTPVIAANVGSVSEFVSHGINGYLYRYEEHEILADHIRRIFVDDSLAQELGENGRQSVVSRFSPSQGGDVLLRIYNHILDRQRSEFRPWK